MRCAHNYDMHRSPLQAARTAQQLSQSEAAALVGLSQTAWSRVERGHQVPRRKVQLAIEQHFGVSISEILKWADGVASSKEAA
jgi:transcriptional regulator with XRE-family HTH domain